MKPFDLKAALAGAPVCTRDGRKVLWWKHFPEFSDAHRIYAHIEGDAGLSIRFEDGRYWDNGAQSKSDLMMATVKREGWINLYRDSFGTCGSRSVHMSRCIADAAAEPNRIACVRIEWEE